jgi:hypothetical protein
MNPAVDPSKEKSPAQKRISTKLVSIPDFETPLSKKKKKKNTKKLHENSIALSDERDTVSVLIFPILYKNV